MQNFTYFFEYGNCGIVDSVKLADGTQHTHSFDEIAIVFSGTSIHAVGKEEYPLMRGDVFVIRGNQVHGYKNLSDFHVLNLVYKREFFENVKTELQKVEGFNTLFVHEPCFRKYHKFKARLRLNPRQLDHISHLAELLKNETINRLPGYKNVVDYLFKTLVINLCRCYCEVDTPHSKSLIKVGRAIDFMEENFSEEINLQKLAEESKMTESTFLRSFKKITNCTPVDYLIRLRIGKAVKMMEKNSDARVIDISTGTGFWNSSYFSKKFKEIMGTTPTNYLKKMRERE